MTAESFYVSVLLPSSLFLSTGKKIDRESFITDCSTGLYRSDALHFLGTAEEASRPQSLTLDSAVPEASTFEDKNPEAVRVSFYFSNPESAKAFASRLSSLVQEKLLPEVRVEGEKDWLEKWREHFKGAQILPWWSIVPIWQSETEKCAGRWCIRMNPSMGFGTGTHATTQLCLEAIGRAPDLTDRRVLDFGAGSGILSVAAALRGAQVDAVEIDEMALVSARACAKENGVDQRIQFGQSFSEVSGNHQSYDFIVANILSEVLIEYSTELMSRLKVGGQLVLSGILSEQVDEVEAVYQTVSENFNYGSLARMRVVKEGWWGLIFHR